MSISVALIGKGLLFIYELNIIQDWEIVEFSCNVKVVRLELKKINVLKCYGSIVDILLMGRLH